MTCLKDKHLATPLLSAPLAIRSQTLRNRVVLAPMSGVTDLPFRDLAWRFGAGLVVTEMVASRELGPPCRHSARLAGRATGGDPQDGAGARRRGTRAAPPTSVVSHK